MAKTKDNQEIQEDKAIIETTTNTEANNEPKVQEDKSIIDNPTNTEDKVKTETSTTSILDEVASKVLASNEDINEVYITSDGTAFYLESDAKNFALNLEDKTIKKVTR